MAKHKNEITVNGNTYLRMYDNKGEFNDASVKALLSGKDIEESIAELQAVGLMEVIENRGEKYYRVLEPKNNPFNVLNI